MYMCKDDDVWVPSVSSGYLASDSLAMHFPYIVMLSFPWNYRDSVCRFLLCVCL